MNRGLSRHSFRAVDQHTMIMALTLSLPRKDIVGSTWFLRAEPKPLAGSMWLDIADWGSARLAVGPQNGPHSYIALCLATGIRTEEARALRWEHVDFGDPVANPPVPASAAVWRSVRAHEDTKTEKSRRTLALPEMAVNALWAHKERQAGERAAAGLTWSERDLVFSTRTGAALDAANVRREFKAACKAANIGVDTPRELRHSLTFSQ